MKSFSRLAVSALSFALPVLAFAQTGTGPGAQQPPAPITSLTGVTGAICTAIGWLFTFLIILAVLFVLLAAFKYLTASGDPEKVKQAGNMLFYAVIAVVVAIIAKGVPAIIGSYFGATFSGC
jgi:heme/copper-type cytochrome/quinol oxidase subunit 2